MKALRKRAAWLAVCFVMLFVASIVMVACDGTETPPDENVTITLSETAITLQLEEGKDTKTLQATVTGSDKEATFASGDTSVVTVSKGAVKNSVRIKAIGPGQTDVTATIGKETAKVSVTVEAPVPVNSVDFVNKGVSINGISFAKGSTQAISLTITYTAATDGQVPVVAASGSDYFELSDVQAADGTATFTLTPKAGADYGSTEITATMGDKSDKLYVDVCSPGIVYDDRASSAVALVVSGTSAAFTDGILVLPRYGYSENEGNYIAVTKLGTGENNEATLKNEGAAITELYTGDMLQEISAGAFRNCTTVKKVTLGKNVVTVGNSAFWNDTEENALTELVFAENGRLTTIDSYAFVRANLTELVIPDTVTNLGFQSFLFNYQLVSAVMPAGLQPGVFTDAVPKGGTFFGCKKLETVTIPAYSFIEYSSFSGCKSITTVNYLGTKAQWKAMQEESRKQFNNEEPYKANAPIWDCENIVCMDGTLPVTLEYVTAPITTLALGKTVEIELTGTHLGEVVFTSEDEAIATVAKKGDNTETGAFATVTAVALGTTNIVASYDGIEVKLSVTVVDPRQDMLQLGATYTNIGMNDGAYTLTVYYTSATEGVEPTATPKEGQTAVEIGALTYVSTDEDGVITATLAVTPKDYGITTITLQIGEITKTVTVEVCSSGLKFEPTGSKDNAGNLNELYFAGVDESFPGGALYVPKKALYNGSYLGVGRIGSGNNAITVAAGKTITDLHTGDGVLWIMPSAFKGISLNKVYLGSYVLNIYEHAFENTGLKEIDFSRAVRLTEIGAGAFMGNTQLTELHLPNSVTTLGGQIFWSNTTLETVYLPEKLQSGSLAFHMSASNADKVIKTVHMPAYEKLPEDFFFGQWGIETVHFAGTKAQFLAMVANSTGNQGSLADAYVYCTDEDIVPVRMSFVTETITDLAIGTSRDIVIEGSGLGEVVFNSSDESVVTVARKTGEGDNTSTKATATLTATQLTGTVTITATYGGVTVTLSVTVVNPYEDSVAAAITYASTGNADGDYSFNITYSSVTPGTVPEVTFSVPDLFDFLITTVSTDPETGLVNATFTVTPKANVFGSTVVTLTMGEKTAKVTIEICSTGIKYERAADDQNAIIVTGVTADFPGGMLYIPKSTMFEGTLVSVQRIGKGAALTNASSNAITDLNTGNGVLLILDNAFKEITTLKTAHIGKYVMKIWGGAFSNSGLETITFAEDNKVLDEFGTPFLFAGNLKAIKVPDTVKTIGSQCFFGCPALTEVWVPAGLTGGRFAFQGTPGNANIKIVHIPVMTAGALPEDCFLNHESIETVYFAGTIEQYNAMKAASAGNNGNLWTAHTICQDGELNAPTEA